MDNNTEVETGVEEEVQDAPTEQKEEIASPQPEQGIDYEALLAEKDAELAKVKEEKENYKKGLLKAKGKLPEEELEEDLSADDKMRQIAQEVVLSTKESQLNQEKDELYKKALKENKEMKLAMATGTSSNAQGSNQEKPQFETPSDKKDEALLAKFGGDQTKVDRFKALHANREA